MVTNNCFSIPFYKKMMLKEEPLLQLFTNVQKNAQSFKAIGDKTRLRIVGLLTAGELCVCDIMAILDLPQSTASRHLAYLKKSGWVVGRKKGKWMNYQLHSQLTPGSMHFQIVTYLLQLTELQKDLQKLSEYLETKPASTNCDKTAPKKT